MIIVDIDLWTKVDLYFPLFNSWISFWHGCRSIMKYLVTFVVVIVASVTTIATTVVTMDSIQTASFHLINLPNNSDI